MALAARASASTWSTSTVADMTDDGDVVAIGRVARARGVRGDVFVQPWTDDPDERFAVGAVLRTEPVSRGPLTVEASSSAGGKLVCHFAGVDDRAGAEALRGTQFVITASQRPPLENPDEFYDTDLIGLSARAVDGTELGEVVEVLHAGGADYLVLKMTGSDLADQERLVPFVSAIVPTVDTAAGIVEVDPPEGLFDA